MMFSVILLFLFMMGISPVHSSLSLSVTCAQDASQDLSMSVSLVSGALTQYVKAYIADESSSSVDITASTPDPIKFTGRSFATTYKFVFVVKQNVEQNSDINESWQCTKDLEAKSVNTGTSGQAIQESSDGSSSAKVTPTYTIIVADSGGTAFSGTQTIGTNAMLKITQNVNYQTNFWFRIDNVEAKLNTETNYAGFYNTTSRCSYDTDVIENPSLKTSQVEINVLFDLFRFVTTDLSSGTQNIVYKVTVKPCNDQSSCQTDACADSPESKRKRRSALNEEDADDLDPVELFATATILPTGAIAPSSKTSGEDDNDTVLEDGLCFGRAPVYAGAAIFVALLISLMCFGFLFVALKRRRNKERLVEYPSPPHSVASVHGIIPSGKSSIRG